jgi:galactokinase
MTADPSFLAAARSRFGVEPVASARAPGRVNLIGDHIDYCGGTVLPMALDLCCHAVVLPNQTTPDACLISTTLDDRTASIPLDRPLTSCDPFPVGSWASYAAGVLAGLAERAPLDALAGARIHIHSDVPPGAGLSSSAAMEVAIARAAAIACNIPIDGLELARLCQSAEHAFAGVPCGLMDQAAAVLARPGSALAFDCAAETHTHVPLPEGLELLVIDSGVRHALADGSYAERRRWCERAALALGTPYLAHADASDLSALDPQAARAARHVTSEHRRTLDAIAALRAGDLPAFGHLLSASHASLRDVYQVSCQEVDRLVEALQSTKGVLGARMTGGGFGGCVIAAIDTKLVDGLLLIRSQRLQHAVALRAKVTAITP